MEKEMMKQKWLALWASQALVSSQLMLILYHSFLGCLFMDIRLTKGLQHSSNEPFPNSHGNEHKMCNKYNDDCVACILHWVNTNIY